MNGLFYLKNGSYGWAKLLVDKDYLFKTDSPYIRSDNLPNSLDTIKLLKRVCFIF